jgi:hypothetical protein
MLTKHQTEIDKLSKSHLGLLAGYLIVLRMSGPKIKQIMKDGINHYIRVNNIKMPTYDQLTTGDKKYIIDKAKMWE